MWKQLTDDQADRLARTFHETYEALAPSHGYETRKESAKPWSEVPEQNKSLMRDVMRVLFRSNGVEPTIKFDPH